VARGVCDRLLHPRFTTLLHHVFGYGFSNHGLFSSKSLRDALASTLLLLLLLLVFTTTSISITKLLSITISIS